MHSKIDFTVSNHLTIVLLQPHTRRAVRWVAEHLPDDAQTFGNAVVVEPRCIDNIVDGIRADGLSVAE